MSAIYDYGGILAIIAARKDESAAQNSQSTRRTASSSASLLGRRLKTTFLALKQGLSLLKFSAGNPYDTLYETYWGIVFQN